MVKPALLTSFTTWKSHQLSNSSDDLLAAVQRQFAAATALHFLRQLPIDYQQAPTQVISRIQELQPAWVICCGMAESRWKLSVETTATKGQHQLQTTVNVQQLVQDLPMTEISHDAGEFVCNRLYYEILAALSRQNLSGQCIFVHIPTLTRDNTGEVLADFRLILQRLGVPVPRYVL
ncbi:hypothetical protein DO97_21080 [Neosynechococcus sphagnicola sy1]|uniref:Peptidase C15 n=1 Tax=Neosynechococcus sphagnicola sy1 TaxID=1497020 RepID=A0A098TLX6_9CYAN|nr:hypothetical protein [Neosynechococcus sphagnicola]KGF73315.1 hypothetical protein DO97_21080 [Neosynechococcus sphagnicola sy1]